MKLSIGMIASSLLAIACGTKTKVCEAVLTAPLDDNSWSVSQWISAADAPVVTGKIDDNTNNRSADGASWFLCTVKNKKKVTKALWQTTGLGVYYLYANGMPVGNEILKPGFTHFEKTKRSFTYDITCLLSLKSKAENVLSVQMTPGWWGDKIITPSGHEGMVGQKCAFRGVLELTYSDGTKQLFGTDRDHWKAGVAGPVRHASYSSPSTREPMGYNNAGHFTQPVNNTEFNGDFLRNEKNMSNCLRM